MHFVRSGHTLIFKHLKNELTLSTLSTVTKEQIWCCLVDANVLYCRDIDCYAAKEGVVCSRTESVWPGGDSESLSLLKLSLHVIIPPGLRDDSESL